MSMNYEYKVEREGGRAPPVVLLGAGFSVLLSLSWIVKANFTGCRSTGALAWETGTYV